MATDYTIQQGFQERQRHRVGFKAARTERFIYPKWLFGFGAATQMQYALNVEA
jgi:hypothetical protein